MSQADYNHKFHSTSISGNKQMANENTRNEFIRDVTFFWAKLDKAVEPFGTLQYEVQVRVPKKRAKELEQYGTVKAQDDGTVSLNLKKKAIKADGTPAAKVKILTKVKGEEISAAILGNGSTGAIKLLLRDYEIKGPNGKVTKRGTQVMPVTIQVDNLVKYEPQASADGFDFDDESESEQEAAPAKGKAGKPKQDDF